jgi:tetratricopeptide (TPR) repeat protein
MVRYLLFAVLGLAAALGGWWAFHRYEQRWFEEELRIAQQEFGAGRFGAARARLTRLAVGRPDAAEVQYWLGSCELAKGNDEAALAAWARVPAAASEAGLAALCRGRLGLESGRYRLAEATLQRAAREPGNVGIEGRRLLGRLYWMMGRREDQRRVTQGEAEQLADPSETLRNLYLFDNDLYPVDYMGRKLEWVRKANPDDDRVWLALADVARRKGQFDEAGTWLARCEQAGPRDPVVWHARLDWARSAGRPDELMRAARHLPASDFTQPEVLRLRAWLAGRLGDRRAERATLEQFVALEPNDPAALERLADLVAQDGDVERVADLRRKKIAAADADERYTPLIRAHDLPPHAVELARAAEQAGRWFDAKVWWRTAVERDPAAEPEAKAALARLAKAAPPAEPASAMLFDLLGPMTERADARSDTAADLEVPVFKEDAARRGLSFTFDNGQTPRRQLPETTSGGVAVLDFDGDGWLDVYAIQGGPFPPPTEHVPFGDRLFRNRGDGTFEDVTTSSGLAGLPGGYGHGAAVGDYDNDGRPDLFVTRWRAYALYHNLGGGRFEDVTSRAGFGGDRDWPTSAAWADLDNDGDLDLYVCHYLHWDEVNPTLCEDVGGPGKGYVYCDPHPVPSMPDHVFRNDGGRFVDVTTQAGFCDANGRGLGVVAVDVDEDGKIDLFVANDTTANYFFRNEGGLKFLERGMESGLATSATGGNLAGMGIACGDFDGDGHLDLAVTNFFDEATTLYHNHGGGLYSDRAAETGLATATRYMLGFGLAALDANNDGLLDLVEANGHVGDYRPMQPYPMPAQLFLGTAAHKLIDVSDRAGADWSILRLGRGLAVGDFDNDGRVDVLIVSGNAPLALFHNEYRRAAVGGPGGGNHFLTLRLEGTTSNRDAIGARLSVTAAGKTQVAARFGGGSFLSASDLRLHFGLGPARTVDHVDVWWPSGRHDRYIGLAADTGYKLREGDPVAGRIPGFRAMTQTP